MAASYQTGSYTQEQCFRGPNDQQMGSWCGQDMAAAPVASSAPADSAGADAVSRLKMLLASNSAVRETALKLLQNTQHDDQQLHDTSRQCQVPLQHAQQQQQLQQQAPQQVQGRWMGTWQSDATNPALPAQHTMRQALTEGSSYTGRSLRAYSPQHSPVNSSPQHMLLASAEPGFPATAGGNAMPAQPSTGTSGGSDWVAELEQQLLECMKADRMQQQASAGFAAGTSGSFTQAQQVHHVQHTSRHWHAPHSRHQQQQVPESWSTAPLPHLNFSGAPAPAAAPFQASFLPNLDVSLGPNGDCSPNPVSSSSSNSSAHGLARRGYGSCRSIGSGSIGSMSASQLLPRLAPHDLPWGNVAPGVKRVSSIDQDELLLNLLQEIVPASRC